MGGELSASLFVGPQKEESVSAWMYILGIISNDKLLKRIKNDPECEINSDDEDDGYHQVIACYGDRYMEDYYSAFEKFLEANNLHLITTHNCNDTVFYIGRKIDNIRADIDKDIEFWKKYNLSVDICAGMTGDDMEISLQFDKIY